MIDLPAAFEAAGKEFLEFERILNPLHPRPDLCAFMKLHELVPGTHDIVSAAEHDQIFLDTDIEKLAAVATQDDIVYLHRCGIRMDDYNGGLAMFV